LAEGWVDVVGRRSYNKGGSFELVIRAAGESAMMLSPSETLHVLLPAHSTGAQSSLEVALELGSGLPAESVDVVREVTGLSLEDVLDILPISNSTLKRRWQQGQYLSSDVADALFQLLHVFLQAARTLGTADKARRWLVTPSRGLNHHTPLSLLTNSLGARKALQQWSLSMLASPAT
jgi:putative toxin-antitoxin system antitoxin component (TIGR02293 family)